MNPPKPPATPRKAVNLRLPEDLHAELVAYAARTERSVNAAAVYAIRQFLTADTGRPDDLHLR